MSLSPSLINTIQQKLIQYVYPIWLVFGITGCILNLFVFSRPKLRISSCCIYFFAASIDHLLTLIIGIVPVLYTQIYSDFQTHSILFCKIRAYLFQVTLMLSRWFIAFASIDRYATCSDKVYIRNFAQTKIAYRVIIVIILIWSILCIHRLIFYEIKENLCGILTNTSAAIYHSLYVTIGGGILPTMIMIICAFLIRKNLINRQKKRQYFSRNKYERSSLDQQILRLLFIQIICYIIFIIPQLINLIFNIISSTLLNRSKEHLAIERFIAFVAELILYLFPVTSFYLYTLTSRTFRCILLQLRTLTSSAGSSQTEPIIAIDHHVKTQQITICFNRNRSVET